MNLHENREVFEEVLAAASLPVEQGGIGVRFAFLEKDYWVTRALKDQGDRNFYTLYSLTFAQTNRVSGLREA